MKNIINLAVQILPKTKKGNDYEIIDCAIDVIAKSGVNYQVCPFETVMEGEYDQLMSIVKQMQEACYNAGAEQVITNIKIQNAFGIDLRFDDKTRKFNQ